MKQTWFYNSGEIIFIMLLWGIALNAQTVTSVTPNSASQGTTDLLVTFILDAETAELPPSDAPVDQITIGTEEGNSLTHNNTVVTGIFSFAFDEIVGAKDVAVTFVPPPDQGGPLVFTLTNGFTVTEMPDTAPTISTQPASKSVRIEQPTSLSVAAYGSAPLLYQWQKEEVNIANETGSSYTISSFAESDTGNYRCVVSNDFGTATSEIAVLTIDTTNYEGTYPLVATGQTTTYDADGNVVTGLSEGDALYGQDANYLKGAEMDFQDDAGDITTDQNTGLMWQKVPSSNDYTWQEAVDYCESLEFGGYDDWRMPSCKELFSISDFGSGWPYLDTTYFILASGQVTKDEQYWSSDYYVGVTVEGGSNAAFGVNHVTGHIKAYSAEASGPVGGKYVRAVRGDNYGINEYVENGDGTITDNATGLMWMQDDNGEGLDWENALAYAEGSEYAGYTDWRLPNVKELQCIVDYGYSPSATNPDKVGPAIDPLFTCTPIINEAGNDDYGYHWTSTSANFTSGEPYYYSWYVAFGMAVNGEGEDFHGAGGVRFDTKCEGGPLGEGGERYYNYVRLVRNTEVTTGIDDSQSNGSYLPDQF